MLFCTFLNFYMILLLSLLFAFTSTLTKTFRALFKLNIKKGFCFYLEYAFERNFISAKIPRPADIVGKKKKVTKKIV